MLARKAARSRPLESGCPAGWNGTLDFALPKLAPLLVPGVEVPALIAVLESGGECGAGTRSFGVDGQDRVKVPFLCSWPFRL